MPDRIPIVNTASTPQSVFSESLTILPFGGAGTQMVVADNTGLLATQALPTGGIGGSGTTNYISKFTPDGNTLGDSLIYENSGIVEITSALVVDTINGNVSVNTSSNPDGYTLNVNGNIKAIATIDIAHGLGNAYLNLGGTDKTPLLNGYRIDANNSELNILTYDGGNIKQCTFTKSGALVLSSSIKTGPPVGGTDQPWKLGQYNATAPTATGYVEVEVNGTLYKLLAAT